MRTLDFFSWYVGYTWVRPGTPLVHRFEVNEIDEKCRTSKALFLRLVPFRLALILGRWHPTDMTTQEMFAHVFTSRNVEMLDTTGELDPRFARSARSAIADHCEDPDDEWQLLRMTGLDG